MPGNRQPPRGGAASVPSLLPSSRPMFRRSSGPRHLAARRIGEVSVESDRAPGDTPAEAEQARILVDGIEDLAPVLIREQAGHAAEAPRDEFRAARTVGDLVRRLEAADSDRRIPI